LHITHHASERKRPIEAVRGFLALALFVTSLTAACQKHIPEDALKLNPESLQERQVQTRVFQTSDEAMVLNACAALLQDLGFNLEESESRLGVIVGSKDRSAVQTRQVIGALLVTVLTGTPVPWEKNQKMRMCVVTRPIGEEKKGIAVRVTFQRIVWNTNNQVTRRECLTDPKMYQEFFDKLSKSLFLEAQQVF
jgi:hypothetical protein